MTKCAPKFMAGFSQSGWLIDLNPTLSPVEREQALAASGKPSNGELHPKLDIFSFSLGEKAGMRASVFSNASFRWGRSGADHRLRLRAGVIVV